MVPRSHRFLEATCGTQVLQQRVSLKAKCPASKVVTLNHSSSHLLILHLSIPTTTMTAPAEPTRICVTTPDGRLDLLKLLAMVLQELHSSYFWKIFKILVCLQLLRLALWSFDRLFGEVADTIADVRTLRKAKKEEARSQRTQYEKRPPV